MSTRSATVIFVVAGLALCLGLVIFLAPRASEAPDGLERVAQEKGFAQKAEGKEVWTAAPLPDYQLRSPGVGSRLGTVLAGVIGTLVVFGVALGMALLIRKRRPTAPSGAGPREADR